MPLPLLFTLPPSNRHDFITLNANTSTLPALNQRITATLAASPNCIEFMAQHKPASASPPRIQQLRVHWDNNKTRDARIWPEYTIVTEDNLGAILAVLGADPGRGVLEVKVGEE